MVSRPYDLSITDDEFATANSWWRSLSINQMKELECKYFPDRSSGANKRMIHQMWQEEGMPAPQIN